MNLVHPDEHEPLHTKITAHYTSNLASRINDNPSSLEDTETAAEYVAKAMNRVYNTRLKAPIRIPNEPEHKSKLGSAANNQYYYEFLNKRAHQSRQKQQQQQQQIQQEMQHQQQEVQQKQTAHQQHSQEKQQPNRSNPATNEAQQAEEAVTAMTLDAQMHAEHQALQSPQHYPAPVYEPEHAVTRSYEIYESEGNGEINVRLNDEELSASPIDRHYRTKYQSYQAPVKTIDLEREREREHEREREQLPQQRGKDEKVRVSASTEIPKAEIMKQIEKSVLKYMKELEAEGKIITTPQETTKSFYKSITTTPNTVEKGIQHSGSTTRPVRYGSGSATHHHQAIKPLRNAVEKQRYTKETEDASSYRHTTDAVEALAPNVEFIYKIKTRAPLQTATVKTVSKPYSLPLKSAAADGQNIFDHSAALRNVEEFDLSHVVTTPKNDEREFTASSTTRPQKLYFNSEIYHDINALPYKQDKLKLLNPDFKGYSGYFAEPTSAENDKDSIGGGSSSNNADDGYPVINPYQLILRKEPLGNKYEELGIMNWGAGGEQHQSGNRKPIYGSAGSQKASTSSGLSLEYDSYNPKYNNNNTPDTYGYPHSGYKTHVVRHTNNGGLGIQVSGIGSASKRGKRGNGSGSGGSSAQLKKKDSHVALRPPPMK